MRNELLANQEGLKSVCGFVPSVLSRHETSKYIPVNSLRDSGTKEKVRFFLISKEVIDNSKDSKYKKVETKNRKYISYSETIKHGDNEYKVNSAKSGIFTSIMHKAIEQLEICEIKWKRVLVVFFNLHHKHYRTKDNKHISRFRKNLNRRLERSYSISEVGYLWVREQEKAKAQHYHFVIFLDGNKVRHSKKILEMVEAAWKAMDAEHHVPVLGNPYYFIDNDEAKDDAIYRISYLAKSRGKGYRDAQVKDYSTSRLVLPHTIQA